MTSIIQFIKLLVSGNTLQGIRARTILSVLVTLSVLVFEVVVYTIYWDEIPDMILFDYDLNGVPNDICEKDMIWYNLLIQIVICILLFVLKPLVCRLKMVRNLMYDSDNKPIPLVNKRFSLFTWELAMLFVTTEQGYVFDLVDIVESPMCDDIVTAIFLFWLIVLILEFRSDIRKIRSERAESEIGKEIE
ncbi:MAG: hypothetical protein J6Z28_03240 [Succinivibrio sp.]|nr:hypothetical protein [Succinivibrio sp.]